MNLYFRTAAGIVGISEAIISTVKDLQSPVGVVNCNICAAGGTGQHRAGGRDPARLYGA